MPASIMPMMVITLPKVSQNSSSPNRRTPHRLIPYSTIRLTRAGIHCDRPGNQNLTKIAIAVMSTIPTRIQLIQ